MKILYTKYGQQELQDDNDIVVMTSCVSALMGHYLASYGMTNIGKGHTVCKYSIQTQQLA